MAEPVEIPDLLNPNLMELSICGKLHTKNAAVIAQIRRLEKHLVALTRFKPSGTYVELFGNGVVKTHLHVDVKLRPTAWRKPRDLVPVKKIQTVLDSFAGIEGDFIIRGEFLIEKTELPIDSFVRSDMKSTNLNGLTAIRRGEAFTIKSKSPLKRLSWSNFGKRRYVIVTLDVEKKMTVGPSYLLNGKQAVLRTFNSLILAENLHGPRHN